MGYVIISDVSSHAATIRHFMRHVTVPAVSVLAAATRLHEVFHNFRSFITGHSNKTFHET